jgi:hypothetical protein
MSHGPRVSGGRLSAAFSNVHLAESNDAFATPPIAKKASHDDRHFGQHHGVFWGFATEINPATSRARPR